MSGSVFTMRLVAVLNTTFIGISLLGMNFGPPLVGDGQRISAIIGMLLQLLMVNAIALWLTSIRLGRYEKEEVNRVSEQKEQSHA